ncbi:MAG: hypothetical protein FJ276_23785 [Planctomycetes bacterium]|nr:hypothetical protein [Planctomycetota bacterium]
MVSRCEFGESAKAARGAECLGIDSPRASGGGLRRGAALSLAAAFALWCSVRAAAAGELTLVLEGATGVVQVGVLDRWDADGNPRVPVDPKARIESPRLTFSARQAGGDRWICSNLPPGRYDLVILLKGQVRIEGFHYPPVLEFDESLPHKDGLKDEVRQAISSDIAQSRHYENKVVPLYMAGDEKTVRVLVQLLRDEATSYDGEYGEPVATLRHEVWQYSHNYGAWTKEKRTRVLDRILTAKRELHQWTWVWVPQLGGITVGPDDVIVRYALPATWRGPHAAGLLPSGS